ncbi:Telomerase Reverse Transcriptase [Manis pentadactyla]|nr:Telomerase Reverse Transcriptase [Manis pentadactyla]
MRCGLDCVSLGQLSGREWGGRGGAGSRRCRAAVVGKGDRDLTLTARETRPWGMKRFLRTRKRRGAPPVVWALGDQFSQTRMLDENSSFV